MKKSDYRDFFASVKPFIKLSYFLDRNHLSRSTFTLFMKGSEHDYMISLDRLAVLYADVCDTLAKVA